MKIKNRYFEKLIAYPDTCKWLYTSLSSVKGLKQAFLFKDKFAEVIFPKHKISSKNLLNLICQDGQFIYYCRHPYKFEVKNDVIKFIAAEKWNILGILSPEKLTYQQANMLLKFFSYSYKNELFRRINLPIKQKIKLANENNIENIHLMKYPSYFKHLNKKTLFNKIYCNDKHIDWLLKTNNFNILRSVLLEKLSFKSLNKIWNIRNKINFSSSNLNLLNNRLLKYEQKMQCKLF